MHPIKECPCEIIVKMPGKKNVHTFLPLAAIPELENFLNEHSEEGSLDWTVVSKESIEKHGQTGMVLRGARFRENMSQKELASLSGVSQENISRIENGKRRIGKKVAIKLAKPLKIDYKLLVEDYIGHD
jgi:DNA-binding XRE family transcriptional regulator